MLVPVIHMKGAGVGRAIAKSSGAFFFIWTLLALGVTALFSVILSARGRNSGGEVSPAEAGSGMIRGRLPRAYAHGSHK